MRHLSASSIILVTLTASLAVAGDTLDEDTAGRLAFLALKCVHQEYPNKISHVLQSDDDARPPHELTPAFYGCFDWHSAVHGHWMLARLAKMYPEAEFTHRAMEVLAKSLTPEKIAGEVAYVTGEGRKGFERPYGLAWLLQLAAELREWDSPHAGAIAPLEAAAVQRLRDWLPKLSYPIRIGEHSQTAFAFGLILDWSRTAGDKEMDRLLVERTRTLYLADRDCPLEYEPSGHDFLSPCLAEADLMRRIMPPPDFAAWLGSFLPVIPLDGSSDWLQPAVVTDPTDGKLVHLDGLNLSRAWMLDGIAAGLPTEDPRRGALESASLAHRRSGLRSVTGEHYEGGHWLGSFAVYLVTGRGMNTGESPAP